ncbi:iron dicitrate transporter FecR [Parapedobacter pyrenivorans]|uniref:Iron dicitrate transporter FecR n=1 Tax=Parapedobacter pyrenivorans TaxID=1305674 RepID=A0A917HQD0_9SPHI|nr:FecR domain-containing protein [Parapedobacter pyrenivorans]GGG86118.1 iron dicitrate transporter FecR [Parapedobacter pyrenivorans]
MKQEAFRKLLRRYANGDCTEKERKFLEDLVLHNPVVGNWEWNSEEEKVLMGIRIKQAIDERRFGSGRSIRNMRWYWPVAASLLVALGGWWFFRVGTMESADKPLRITETSAFPSDGVRLTLADGSVISLDSLDKGVVDVASGSEIIKLDAGKLVYAHLESGDLVPKHGKQPMNTIHIPNGKQFQLTLPDGTDVWVNTATTLTYPVSFTGGKRSVELDGEAYFEVAKDESRPFEVVANGTSIVVTGTRFNVSAYASDNGVTTTLVEGGVTVRAGAREAELSPGDQAIVGKSGKIERRRGGVEQALAWKNGYFIFDDMDIQAVMRSVARWYDVRVTIGVGVSAKRFGGSFPITAGVDELLTDLETVGNIKFEREGKEVELK